MKKNTLNKDEEDFRRQLLEDMDFVSGRLRQIHEIYDMTDEPELVDALIYEELAMRARFDYLVKTAKERNIKCRISISD